MAAPLLYPSPRRRPYSIRENTGPDGGVSVEDLLASPGSKSERSRAGARLRVREIDSYGQPGNLKLAIRVDQLNVPLVFRYSVVYQKVHWSTGSIARAL